MAISRLIKISHVEPRHIWFQVKGPLTKHRMLGKSGLKVSVVGLGCNNFGFVAGMDLEASRKVIDKAIDSGINFFDTSDSYGSSEEILGRCCAGADKRLCWPQSWVQLDQEGKKRGASRAYIFCHESSLRRLHRYGLIFTSFTPRSRYADGRDPQGSARLSSKARSVASVAPNLSAAQLVEAQHIAEDHQSDKFCLQPG